MNQTIKFTDIIKQNDMTGTTILNYRVVKKIGEGGLGEIYLGEHISINRKAAIKVLLPEFSRNEDIKRRFENEAATLAGLDHENIVRIYDFARLDSNLYIIMEFIDGITLDEIINRNPYGIPVDDTVRYFKQILEAFKYAHSKGIVHRDIKPSNIILRNDGLIKILDFGIAKILDKDIKLTKTGMRIGSVLYMSPEQILGPNIDFRSDIYSLGITLFEMLNGRLPFNSENKSEFEIQKEIVSEPLPVISNQPVKINKIIERATEKDLNLRYQNCDEFLNDLLNNNSENDLKSYSKTVSSIIRNNDDAVYHSNTKAGLTGKKLILFMSVIAVVALITILIALNISDKKDDAIKNVSSKVEEKKKVNLVGEYSGTIKDGTYWTLKVDYFDGVNIEGSSTAYWNPKKPEGVYSGFKGTFYNNENKIILDETLSGSKSGRFIGYVLDDGARLEGSWTRYSDNGTYNWKLTKIK